jgi:uncharacterized protein (DUF433 family)
MTLKELEYQLLALSDHEKVQVVQLLSQTQTSLIQGIEKTPGVCGGSACVAGIRITVWGLVKSRRIGYSEADLLTSYPTLSATNLANAWTYAAAFSDEIEAEIAENNAVMNPINNLLTISKQSKLNENSCHLSNPICPSLRQSGDFNSTSITCPSLQPMNIPPRQLTLDLSQFKSTIYV